MKKNLGSLPAVCPMPVLMIGTYDENGKVDVMNAAWGQICDTDKICISLSDDHKTVLNFLKTKAFTVGLADVDHLSEADWFGTVSGNDTEDKFERTGMHAVESEFVKAPIIEEFPLTMECELIRVLETDGVYAVMGKIVNVKAEESILNAEGKVDITKANLALFDQFGNAYYRIGDKLANAWEVWAEKFG
ncbi:MAG: flavin reductase family protein [Erysipelotrichaceae bacterium]|nr:flavin reductase family protein [Erysipelotrichaceae bacterium]